MAYTTSTVPTVKRQLVDLLTTALSPVNVFYAWNPEVTDESVFFGRPFLADADRFPIRIGSVDPTIKAGRRQRNEDYTLDLTVWSWRPDLLPDEAATAEARVFAIGATVENTLVGDINIGLTDGLLKVLLGGMDAELVPFQTGWAARLTYSLDVSARLT